MPRFRFALAALLVFASPLAFANGLYLKLAEGPRPTDGVASVTLTLQAVSTYDFTLPQTPLFVVDDGSGMRIASSLAATPIGVPKTVRVTPERRFDGAWRLDLAPGRYKVKVRYKLAGRTVESNAIKLEVPAPASAAK